MRLLIARHVARESRDNPIGGAAVITADRLALANLLLEEADRLTLLAQASTRSPDEYRARVRAEADALRAFHLHLVELITEAS